MSKIHKTEVFKEQMFTAGAGLIKTSPAIDLREIADDYVFSLYSKHGGTGTVKIEAFVAAKKDAAAADWIEAAADIAASQATNTASMYAVVPTTLAMPFMRFVATASAETVTGLEMTLFSR